MSTSTPIAMSGLSEGRSPAHNLSPHGRRISGAAAASPAKMMLAGSMSSPGMSQTNMPSPATFAKMAAAVGVQNPLDDTGRTIHEAPNTSKTSASLTDMSSNIDTFIKGHLNRLEAAGNHFFDLYENALEEGIDLEKVSEAHHNLLAIYQELLILAAQSGLAAVPCPKSGSLRDVKFDDLDTFHDKLVLEAQDTFKRRDTLREGASMVTSILMQGSTQK